jgi:hypothetical protein
VAAGAGGVVGSRRGGWRERTGVLVLAGAIVGGVGAYLVLTNATGGGAAKNLLPYQTLAATLPVPDQQTFGAIRAGLLVAEEDRAAASAWPDPARLADRGVAPFAATNGGPEYRWSRLQDGAIIDYFGQPADASQPAWLLEIQEPEPGMPPDPAPPDEEHHRLPDGTMLHVYVWMHPYGGQVPVGFVRQPQTSGWTEVFSRPPNPVYYNRR